MTPQEREQQAREFTDQSGVTFILDTHEQTALEWLGMVLPKKTINIDDIQLLGARIAAQRAAVLEEVEKEVKGRRCELGLKLYPSRPLFSGLRENYAAQDEALRLFEGWISKKAQEQRL